MTTDISLNCTDQVLTLLTTPEIAAGGINVNKAVFTFNSKWDDFTKTAVFYNSTDKTPYRCLLDNDDACIVPSEVTATPGLMYIGVFGVSGDIKRTTRMISYEVRDGANSENLQIPDPTPDIYTQIITRLNALRFNINGLTAETDIEDTDTMPFYDGSATEQRKTLWSNIKLKLKTYFDTSYKGIESYPLVSGQNLYLNNITNSNFVGNYNVLGGYAPSIDYKSFVYANYAFVYGSSCRALDADATNRNAQADFGATFGKNLWNCSHGLLCGINGKNAPDDLLALANGSGIYSPNGIVFRVKSNGAAQTAHVPTDANDLVNKAYVDSVAGGGGGGGLYTLPTASADTLGGVKVGSGLSIIDGVLSAIGGAGSSSVPQMNEIIETTEEVNQIIFDVPEDITDVEIQLKVPTCPAAMNYGYFIINGVSTGFNTVNWGNNTADSVTFVRYYSFPTGSVVFFSPRAANVYTKVDNSISAFYGVSAITSVGIKAYGAQTFPIGTRLGIRGR